MSIVRAGVVAVLIGVAALGAVQHPKSGNERSTGWGAKRPAHSTPKHAGGWTTKNWGNGGRTAERSRTSIERKGNWGFGRPRYSDGGRHRARAAGRGDPGRERGERWGFGRDGDRGFGRDGDRGFGRHRDREFGRDRDREFARPAWVRQGERRRRHGYGYRRGHRHGNGWSGEGRGGRGR
ncbi:hypothetical protein [Streptosporangium sp. LJ11]|uniref:hypothetical protein n=1 Tax=Streptosporangium sp. LJ11 TaxID=3436927 RepID=UPI003F79ABBA